MFMISDSETAAIVAAYCRFRLKAATVSDAKAASIPISSRPAFRFEGGHPSDMKPATLPL